MGTASELLLQVVACHFLQRCLHMSPDKEMLILDCCEGRMVWEPVTLPLLNDRQRPTDLDFIGANNTRSATAHHMHGSRSRAVEAAV